MKFLSRSVPLTFLLMLSAALSTLQARETRSERLLGREIRYLVEQSRTPHTLKALDVFSRRRHKTIYSSLSELLLQPASNLKIVTTSFALHDLGPDYTFTTPFDFAGVQRSDTLLGDLLVVGKGDPIISVGDLDSAAEAISQSGISVVTGNLVVDVSRFDSLQWGSGWMWDDEPEPYAMFIGPAEVSHDVVSVNVTLNASGTGLSITTDPATSFIKVDDRAVPGPVDTLDVTREMIGGVNTIVVTGTYTRFYGGETYQFSVRHPGHYFGAIFRELLKKHGVKIEGSLVVTRNYTNHLPHVQVFTLMHSIDTVVTYTNKVSDNLGAECFLREVPMAMADEVGSAKNGIKLEKKFLALCGVDTTEYHIFDGSGVSHYNLITPDAIVKVLRFDLDQPYTKVFLQSLPIAGEDGTLEDRMTQDYVRGRVIAKTGSISGVRTLSGYVFIPGDTLVFSMMMQNIGWDPDSLKALENRLCSVLAQYSANSRIFARNLRRYRLGTYGLVRYESRKPAHKQP